MPSQEPVTEKLESVEAAAGAWGEACSRRRTVSSLKGVEGLEMPLQIELENRSRRECRFDCSRRSSHSSGMPFRLQSRLFQKSLLPESVLQEMRTCSSAEEESRNNLTEEDGVSN